MKSMYISSNVLAPVKRAYFKIDDSFSNNRQIFSEIFDPHFDEWGSRVERLSVAAVRVMAANYSGGPVPAECDEYDRMVFAGFLDVHLDIEKVIDIDIDVYWKRVAQQFSRRSIDLIEAEQKRKGFAWKNLAMELKFSRMLENTNCESWYIETMTDIARKICPYIRKLDIRSLKAIKEQCLEKNPYNSNYRVYNHSDTWYRHGDLSFLGELRRLTVLSIDFSTENLKYGYHKRYFELSSEDFINLTNGISKLPSLKTLVLCGNKMNCEKMRILMNGIRKVHIERLDLSFCHLDASSIDQLALYLGDCKSKSLKYLVLMGNHIGGGALAGFAAGLALFAGNLRHLGLSQNPLDADGIQSIVAAIVHSKRVEQIDISGCLIGPDGEQQIAILLEEKSQLRKINISSVQISNECATEIIRCLKNNYDIVYFECRNCELSLEQETNIRVLIDRNVYYKKYPYLLKDNFTEEEEAEIDGILSKDHHRLLDRAQDAVRMRKIPDGADTTEYYQNLYDENEIIEKMHENFA